MSGKTPADTYQLAMSIARMQDGIPITTHSAKWCASR